METDNQLLDPRNNVSVADRVEAMDGLRSSDSLSNKDAAFLRWYAQNAKEIEVRLAALNAIRLTGSNPDDSDLLTKCLDSGDQRIVFYAALCIAELGVTMKDSVGKLLLLIVDCDTPVYDAICQAVAAIGPAAVDAVSKRIETCEAERLPRLAKIVVDLKKYTLIPLGTMESRIANVDGEFQDIVRHYLNKG